ncbi:hypothetical protein MNBD_BACTEROID05-22 [hydrothermal vent metagenome]|uniref:Uncharacterized protein n=1 Tax=hydrothermal vent metagenome TaxID=652676 RepID=A0A3B0TTM2_9ZZZZ
MIMEKSMLMSTSSHMDASVKNVAKVKKFDTLT